MRLVHQEPDEGFKGAGGYVSSDFNRVRLGLTVQVQCDIVACDARSRTFSTAHILENSYFQEIFLFGHTGKSLDAVVDLTPFERGTLQKYSLSPRFPMY